MDAPDNITETPVIELSGVTVGSAPDLDRVVLEGVNWKVGAGEYWVVGGMHAAGKTDLISMLTGLTPPMDGEYRLFGRPMPFSGDEPAAERLRIGRVFEHGQLLHQLTIKENVALPLRYHRDIEWQEVERRVGAMLEATELSPHADALPGRVARHWQKRAGLARALILEPEVLLVDNPLSGLDPRQAAWWLNFLGQLSAGRGIIPERRVTLVLTADDLRPWRRLPCHFALLKKQNFLVLGQCAKLEEHQDSLVQELLAQEASRA
jgi:ABC-type transporter Mla maintaining outer membrane lipid asymmetry ATPase subunit MlaF